MEDEVRQMTQRNVRAVYVGDADNSTECTARFQLAYLSPEAHTFNKRHVQSA